MNWPPDAFIFMKVGTNGDETLDAIMDRKRREIEKAGMTFWSYGSRGPLHPKTQVQPFAQDWVEKQGSVYLLMEQLPNRGPAPGPRAEKVRFASNGQNWKDAPKGIRSGPYQHALVLGEITQVDKTIDLGDFEVGIGPKKGVNAANYIRGQVSRGCFVSASSSTGDSSKRIAIGYCAPLLYPYAAFLCPHSEP